MSHETEEARKNIDILVRAYGALSRPNQGGVFPPQVGVLSDSVDHIGLRKLIMQNAELLKPTQLISAGTEERVLLAGTVIKIDGIPFTLGVDTPVSGIKGNWELIDAAAES